MDTSGDLIATYQQVGDVVAMSFFFFKSYSSCRQLSEPRFKNKIFIFLSKRTLPKGFYVDPKKKMVCTCLAGLIIALLDTAGKMSDGSCYCTSQSCGMDRSAEEEVTYHDVR